MFVPVSEGRKTLGKAPHLMYKVAMKSNFWATLLDQLNSKCLTSFLSLPFYTSNNSWKYLFQSLACSNMRKPTCIQWLFQLQLRSLNSSSSSKALKATQLDMAIFIKLKELLTVSVWIFQLSAIDMSELHSLHPPWGKLQSIGFHATYLTLPKEIRGYS